MRRSRQWMLAALAVLAFALLAVSVFRCAARRAPSSLSGWDDSGDLGLVLLNDEQCVYVLAVSDQSPAHRAGVEPGDYILNANGLEIADTEALDALLQTAKTPLLLTIRRQGMELVLSIPNR